MAEKEKMKSMDQLLEHELADLYDAEQQLVKALPKMAKAATASELRQSIEQHLEVTKEQVRRLEAAFRHLNKEAKAVHCDGMAGLMKEGEKGVEESANGEIRDLTIMAGAARVEHYEMSAYRSALTLAHAQGQKQVAELLQQSMGEEEMTAQHLETTLMQKSGVSQQSMPYSSRSTQSGSQH
jgi:ferritin-like metal-binding protein YciE